MLFSLLFIYWPSFNNFFFGDDFFNFVLSKTDNLKGVINFFNPIKAPPEFPFYRPLTTQVFYWLGKRIFGFNPLGYHVINFSFFLISLFLVYDLVKRITKDVVVTYLTTFFYAFSGSHFYRLYYLSQFQETGLTVFYLLSTIFYINFIKNRKNISYFFSLLFFFLAIASKETAISLPFVLLLIDLCFLKEKKSFSSWLKKRSRIILPFLIFIGIYLFLRLFFFGFSQGEEYKFVLSSKSIIKNLLWYFLWSVGFPETFVNITILDPIYFYNPGFFTDLGKGGAMTNFLFLTFFVFCLLGVKLFFQNFSKKRFKRRLLLICFSSIWFLITLSLVMFFPFHKFSYSVTLPLFGASLLLALVLKEMINFSRVFFFLSLFLFLLANISSYSLAFKTHWSVKRAKIAKKVLTFFKENYPQLPERPKIYFFDIFINNYCTYPPEETEKSRELNNVLIGSKGLELFYDKDIDAFFQHITPLEEVGTEEVILVSAGQFF